MMVGSQGGVCIGVGGGGLGLGGGKGGMTRGASLRWAFQSNNFLSHIHAKVLFILLSCE